MLRDLLRELPFVEVEYWGEASRPDPANWLAIYARYQPLKHLGWRQVAGGDFPVWLFNGITHSARERFDQRTLEQVFTSLAADPRLFEAQQINCQGATAYLVTLHGVHVLYELVGSSLHVAYLGSD